MIETSAINFMVKIDDKSKFRLVNNSFIIKYRDDGISEHIADFHKANSVLNDKKTNVIRLNENEHKQLFQKRGKKVFTHTRMDIQDKYPTMNFWKELTIKFDEKPIEEILK